MNILIINTSDVEGGCAIAASRLANGLARYYNVQSTFLVGWKHSELPNVVCTRNHGYEFLLESMLDRYSNLAGLQYQCFPFSSRNIRKAIRTLRPNLVYLRNTHGGYFATSLIREISRSVPVAWTLSDMWSFTGHCAHTFGNEGWKRMESGCPDKAIYPSIGIDTGKWLLRQKKNIFRKSNISLVTPSKWLYNLTAQSPVFDGKEIVQIYNGFDLGTFRPKRKEVCREALSIPTEARTVMFCADHISDGLWKGGQMLLDILRKLNARAGGMVHVLVIGAGHLLGTESLRNLKIHSIGQIRSDEIMATCFSAADVFIYPTRADNLPNVLLEAISCGTPCVTFDIGGCNEIIINGVNGYCLKPFDVDLFSELVLDILSDSQKQAAFARSARRIAEEQFSLERMSREYFQFFQKVAGKH